MDQLRRFFAGDTVHHYIENGFSEEEARALTWIGEQKPKGKFYGLISGAFVVATWRQWHQRIFGQFGIRGGLIWSQIFIVGVVGRLGSRSCGSGTM